MAVAALDRRCPLAGLVSGLTGDRRSCRACVGAKVSIITANDDNALRRRSTPHPAGDAHEAR
jgi:hypothetical protein